MGLHTVNYTCTSVLGVCTANFTSRWLADSSDFGHRDWGIGWWNINIESYYGDSSLVLYIHWVKKQYTWLLIITSANVHQFTKFFYCQIPEEILYTDVIKIFLSYLKYVCILPCNVWKLQLQPISMTYFMWDLIILLARYEAALIAQVWILWSWNLKNNAAGRRRESVMSANGISGWLTCNMGCSRQSLMKLAPMNGVNACELVFVSEMGVLALALTFRVLIM